MEITVVLDLILIVGELYKLGLAADESDKESPLR